MRKSDPPRYVDARMLWVQLPRVQIKRHRLSGPVDLFYRLFGHLIRIYPKIGSARDRHRKAGKFERRDRKFDKLELFPRYFIREPRSIGNAVAVIKHRENTRIVLDPKLTQDIQCPKRLLCD